MQQIKEKILDAAKKSLVIGLFCSEGDYEKVLLHYLKQNGLKVCSQWMFTVELVPGVNTNRYIDILIELDDGFIILELKVGQNVMKSGLLETATQQVIYYKEKLHPNKIYGCCVAFEHRVGYGSIENIERYKDIKPAFSYRFIDF